MLEDNGCWCGEHGGIAVQCPWCESTNVGGACQADTELILFWMCQDCEAKWPRYSPDADPRLYRKALNLMNEVP